MEIKPEFRDKTIRSFVVRAGRMTKAQRSAFEQGWECYGLRLADGMIDLGALFGRNNTKGGRNWFWYGRFVARDGRATEPILTLWG